MSETNLPDRGTFRRASIKSYCARWSKPNPSGIFDPNVAEVIRSQGFTWEEAPRSVYDPKQLYTALERYATDWKRFEIIDEHLAFGFRKAYKIFAKPKNDLPLEVRDDVDYLVGALKMSKSSGLPLMTTKEKSLTYSLNRAGQVLSGTKAPNPCVAYARTGADDRTRLVWGYPLEMTIIESVYARPLIEQFKSMSTPMAFGLTKAELGAKIHAYIVNSPGTVVCMDYSKYDQTISARLIEFAFRILETWFTKEDLDQKGWKTIVRYFINTPIVMPNGKLYTVKRHGVPSGSYFTQLVDSIVNVILIYSLVSSCGLKLRDDEVYVLGDDSIFACRSTVDLEKWSKALNRYGLILHDDDKTVVGQAHFLGAVWEKGKPYGVMQELVNKACFPEKYRDYQGKPRQGAQDVLRSYASSYVNGWRLLPSAKGMDWFNYHTRDESTDEDRFLTGSDAFHRHYGRGDIGKGGFPSWLSVRILV